MRCHIHYLDCFKADGPSLEGILMIWTKMFSSSPKLTNAVADQNEEPNWDNSPANFKSRETQQKERLSSTRSIVLLLSLTLFFFYLWPSCHWSKYITRMVISMTMFVTIFGINVINKTFSLYVYLASFPKAISVHVHDLGYFQEQWQMIFSK